MIDIFLLVFVKNLLTLHTEAVAVLFGIQISRILHLVVTTHLVFDKVPIIHFNFVKNGLITLPVNVFVAFFTFFGDLLEFLKGMTV